jgi:predicted N-acyltransferase
LGEQLGARALVVFGRREGEWVGAALNLVGREALYGRNWGGREDLRFLHFETCYYQAIDYAIARKLARVEAGAQGEHKLQRGYLPVTTHSAHWIRHAGFRRAIADFLERERHAVRATVAELLTHSPFKTA